MTEHRLTARIGDIRAWCCVTGTSCVQYSSEDYVFQGMPHVPVTPFVDGVGPTTFCARVPAATVIHGDCKGSVYYYVLASDGTLFVDGLNMHPRYHMGRADSFARAVSSDLEVEVDLSSFIRWGRLRGVHVLIGGMRNYFHWLFEYLPRVHVLSRARANGESYLMNDDLSHYQVDTLKLLGISPSMCTRLPRHACLLVDDLIVPSIVPLPEAIKFLRSTFLDPDFSRPLRRVFVSRCDSLEPRVKNERLVMESLCPLGFETVTLAGMPFRRQVELFERAEIVVGAHGAGLANIVWCSPPAQVVEIVNQINAPYTYFSAIAENVG